MKLKVPQATKSGYILCCEMGCFDWSFPTSKVRRGRVQGGGNVCPTLMANDPEIYVFLGYEEM